VRAIFALSAGAAFWGAASPHVEPGLNWRNFCSTKLKARDPAAAAKIGDLAAEHRSGAERLRRVAQAVESVLLMDWAVPRHTVDGIIRDFIVHARRRRECGAADKLHFPAIPTHPVKLCLANDYKD